jgi:hypothetical protein
MNGERVMNGDQSYSDHHSKHQNMPRSAKKPAPAPPVPQYVKHTADRVMSINGNIKSHSRNNSDSLEAMVSSVNKDLMAASVDSTDEISFTESTDSNHSAVVYSTASLDRPAKRATDSAANPSERQIGSDRSDRKVSSAAYQLRNKVIEKPNVPPPSVPSRPSLERPQSVHERPSVPPPERPQRSCDSKTKQRSLECLNDDSTVNSAEDKSSVDSVTKSGENHASIPKTFDSEVIDSDDCVLTSADSESYDNSSVDSLKTKNSLPNDCITFADDSDVDVEDNNNVKYKMDANLTQRSAAKQTTIPVKPPRSQSPALQKETTGLQSIGDDSPLIDFKSNPIAIGGEVSESALNTTVNANTGQQIQPKPRRPLPPNKPRIAAASEDTHL